MNRRMREQMRDAYNGDYTGLPVHTCWNVECLREFAMQSPVLVCLDRDVRNGSFLHPLCPECVVAEKRKHGRVIGEFLQRA